LITKNDSAVDRASNNRRYSAVLRSALQVPSYKKAALGTYHSGSQELLKKLFLGLGTGWGRFKPEFDGPAIKRLTV
jgi:hypothetical protein